MRRTTTFRITFCAVFAALCCAATMAVRIPTPAGYTNLGEGVVLLSGFLLGPQYGALAAAAGSALADLLAGYGYYVPGTFLIKGGTALLAAWMLRAAGASGGRTLLRTMLCALPAELWMVAGYFGYKALILRKGLAAAASIPNNLVQALTGVVLASLLYRALLRVPEAERFFRKGGFYHV